MSKNTVDLTVSQLIEDLSNGLTWLKKEDEGFGSIQEKYQANDIQIKTIQKHPKLVGIEPSITVFRVIDDTKDDSKSNQQATSANTQLSGSAKEPAVTGTNGKGRSTVVPVVAKEAELVLNGQSSQSSSVGDEFDAL